MDKILLTCIMAATVIPWIVGAWLLVTSLLEWAF